MKFVKLCMLLRVVSFATVLPSEVVAEFVRIPWGYAHDGFRNFHELRYISAAYFNPLNSYSISKFSQIQLWLHTAKITPRNN